MKNNYIAILTLISFSYLFGACKKQLDVYPSTTEVDGNIITDAKSAATALNGVYYQFAAGGLDQSGVLSSLWYSVNEMVPSQLSGMFSYAYGGGGLDVHKYNSETQYIDVIWNNGYAIVNSANGFLKNLTPLSPQKIVGKDQMIAEAKFMRAFGNSQLLLYYGQYYDTSSAYGIILKTDPVAPDNLYQSRVSVAVAYDSILADLDNAIPHLPNTNTQIWYANVWAAKLLKARVLINRGSPSDYAQVIGLTNDIITNSSFSLEPNTKDLFWSKGLTSNEIMLGVKPYPNQNWKWTNYIFNAYYGPNKFMKQLFTGDPRAAWCIQTVDAAYVTTTGFTKYYHGSVTDISATPITENAYPFRLTEAYLLEAEALAASGGSMNDARTLLKTVMAHAGFTDFTAVDATAIASDLQLLIVEEEMKNFVGEAGQDWLALRRLPFATIQSLLPSLKAQSLLILPIPQAEITSNDKIKQNPNY